MRQINTGLDGAQAPETTSGTIVFKGTNIELIPQKEIQKLRRYSHIVFQDPSSSLDPAGKYSILLQSRSERTE